MRKVMLQFGFPGTTLKGTDTSLWSWVKGLRITFVTVVCPLPMIVECGTRSVLMWDAHTHRFRPTRKMHKSRDLCYAGDSIYQPSLFRAMRMWYRRAVVPGTWFKGRGVRYFTLILVKMSATFYPPCPNGRMWDNIDLMYGSHMSIYRPGTKIVLSLRPASCHQISLFKAMREVLPQVWKPRNQGSLITLTERENSVSSLILGKWPRNNILIAVCTHSGRRQKYRFIKEKKSKRNKSKIDWKKRFS